MKKKINNFSFQNLLAFKLSFLLLAAMLMPQITFSQGKVLTQSIKVKKTGFLDHSIVRKEYKAYADKLKQFAIESTSEKNKLEKVLSVINIEAEKKIKQDSLVGNNKRDRLIDEYNERRKTVLKEYQTKLKQINQAKQAFMQACEQKIKFAIDAVLNEGGFTDIKPIGKDINWKEGIDITKLVLKKLN